MSSEEGIIIYFKRKVGKSGDSLYITIPSEIVDSLKIKQGEEMKIYAKDYNTIVIRKNVSG